MSTSQAPEGQQCVGPQSADAGKADSCAGCPNRAICASGAARQPDPDVELIRNRLRGVRARILVLSGKGGVGKSTMTKELAYALAHSRGLNVGIVDADLCGPSQPRMLGVRDEGEPHRSALGLEPVAVDEGVSLMSIHFLLNEASAGGRNQSVTWRGPQKNGMLKTFLRDVDWTGSGALDVLLIDTPPGTTDEHITLATLLMQVQKLEEEEAAASGVPVPTFTGAVVVTTPQTVAIADVRRELTFCEKARVPVLGLIENMSGFVCPCCGLLSSVFGGHAAPDAAGASSGVSALGQEFNIPVLGAVPLDPAVMIACEQGIPLSSVDVAAALREVTTPAPGHVIAADAGGATLEALDAISAAIISQVPCLTSS